MAPWFILSTIENTDVSNKKQSSRRIMKTDEHMDYLSSQARVKISNSGSTWLKSDVILSLTPLCITFCVMYVDVELKWEAIESAQRLKACSALAKNWRSIPSTHTTLLTTICNSRLRGFDGPFWPLSHLHSHAHTSHYGLIIKNKYLKKLCKYCIKGHNTNTYN